MQQPASGATADPHRPDGVNHCRLLWDLLGSSNGNHFPKTTGLEASTWGLEETPPCQGALGWGEPGPPTLILTQTPNPDPEPNPNPNLDPDPGPDPNPNLDPDLDPNPNADHSPDSNIDPDPNPNPNPDPYPNPNPDPLLSLSSRLILCSLPCWKQCGHPEQGNLEQLLAAAQERPALPTCPNGPHAAICAWGWVGWEGPGPLWSPSPSWEVPGGCWSSPELLCWMWPLHAGSL